MTTVIVVIVIALVLLAVVLFYVAVHSRSKQAGQSLHPVNLKAFRSLTDRDDELFLRGRLPRAKFFRLKRHRIRVTFRYVARIATNASAVLRITGETIRVSSTPEVADAAAEVMDLVTQIRIQCLIAMSKLIAEYAVPSLQLTPGMLAPKYQSLRESVSRLGALTQNRAPLAIAI